MRALRVTGGGSREGIPSPPRWGQSRLAVLKSLWTSGFAGGGSGPLVRRVLFFFFAVVDVFQVPQLVRL